MTTNDNYQPKVYLSQAPAGLDELQELTRITGSTHVQTANGKVYKIFNQLNKKSVPLNHAGTGPQRIPYSKVKSFGRLN